MEFLTGNAYTSSFFPYFPGGLCKWGSINFAYCIIFSYSIKRDAKNKTILVYHDTNQPHTFYFVAPILISFTLSAGSIEVISALNILSYKYSVTGVTLTHRTSCTVTTNQWPLLKLLSKVTFKPTDDGNLLKNNSSFCIIYALLWLGLKKKKPCTYQI